MLDSLIHKSEKFVVRDTISLAPLEKDEGGATRIILNNYCFLISESEVYIKRTRYGGSTDSFLVSFGEKEFMKEISDQEIFADHKYL